MMVDTVTLQSFVEAYFERHLPTNFEEDRFDLPDDYVFETVEQVSLLEIDKRIENGDIAWKKYHSTSFLKLDGLNRIEARNIIDTEIRKAIRHLPFVVSGIISHIVGFYGLGEYTFHCIPDETEEADDGINSRKHVCFLLKNGFYVSVFMDVCKWDVAVTAAILLGIEKCAS